MMDKFDSTVVGAIEIAQSEALKFKNPEMTPHHFLYGLIKHPKSTVSKHLKAELNSIQQMIEALPQLNELSLDQLKFSVKMQEWFTLASSSALNSGRQVVSEVDFLRHLSRFYPQIKLEIPDEEQQSEKPDFLEDLNELAAAGKLDPVIGRSQEIRKLMEILCRRAKNNPVLVGLAGVGKTAIVEGFANLIVKNQVPDLIQDRKIYSLQMGNLVAGTKYRGDFEEKIQNMLSFLKDKGREAILFIDELHLLIGAGKTEGAIDAANLLKPALARAEFNCIGATTLEEYRKYIESDSALERRFHKVAVDAPDVSETIQILTGLKEKLEIHHGIDITSEAIIAAAQLSDRYISDRNLPDKAIDIIDEAAAALKLNADSPPPEVQELESQIAGKKIIASSLESGNDKLNQEIKKLEEQLNTKKEAWDKSVLELKKAAQLKKQLDDAQFEFEKKTAEGNYEEASKIKYTLIRELNEKINELQISWKLTKKDVANVIHSATGIPLEKIIGGTQRDLLDLADSLNSRVLGQTAAITEISDTLIASHAGLTDQNRTLGSFLMLGPSGVGKTETAKQLAGFLFHDERNLIRMDLSEFRESHSVAKLIGSPPGYVGYDQGGFLTEAVRTKPYSVILFDEIEKAHPDFGDILLQIIDDGRLTDSHGRVIDFKNTVVMVTSNLKDYESHLKPELIGRFDAILHFRSLTKDIVSKLVSNELKMMNEKLDDKKLEFSLSPSITEKIIELGFDERYGARPLKNTFNRLVVKPVSKFIVNEKTNPGKYLIDVVDKRVKFKQLAA